MSGRRAAALVWGLSLLMALGCSRNEDRSRYVAVVGDRVLDTESVRAWLPNASDPAQNRAELRQFVESWIETELLAREARKRGLGDEAAIQRELRRVEDELRAQAALRALLPDTFQVTNEEILQYYRANQDAYRRDRDEVRLQEILVGQRSLAREIYRRAKADEDFAALAKRYSQGPWAERGGDTGVIPKEDLPAALRQRLRRAKPGQILGPIRIEDGYLVVKVLGVYPAGSVRSLDEVRDEIEVRLKRRKYRAAYRRLIRDLSQRTEVWVNEKLLGEKIP